MPDPLYRLAVAVLPELARDGVFVVSHSLFLPYVLLVVHIFLEFQRDIDAERLVRFLTDAERQVNDLVRKTDNSLAMAIKMLQNFHDQLRQGLSALKERAVSLREQALAGSEAAPSILAGPEGRAPGPMDGGGES